MLRSPSWTCLRGRPRDAWACVSGQHGFSSALKMEPKSVRNTYKIVEPMMSSMIDFDYVWKEGGYMLAPLIIVVGCGKECLGKVSLEKAITLRCWKSIAKYLKFLSMSAERRR